MNENISNVLNGGVIGVPLDVATIAQLVVAVIFLGSGGLKLIAPKKFAYEVKGLMQSATLASLVAMFVILVELLVGVAYLTDHSVIAASWSAVSLLCLFAIIASIVIHRGVPLKCMCFGAKDAEWIDARVFWRIGGMLALVSTVLLNEYGNSNSPGEVEKMVSRDMVLHLVTALALLAIARWCFAISEVRKILRGCAACRKGVISMRQT